MRETLLAMFGSKPWPFGRPPYLGSKLAGECRAGRRDSSPDNVGHRRGFTAVAVLPGRASARLLKRNRPIPSGKWVPIPANTGAAREYAARDREWPKRASVIVVGACPGESLRRFRGRRSGQLSAGAWGSSGELLGSERSESNRKRLSASKGTREAQPSMAVARIGRRQAVESLPMRRLGGGASVVVRGRECRPHGEGTQDVSFWAAKAFMNREGSR
jgi:hypothetical protein